jgi:hypothetical protein
MSPQEMGLSTGMISLMVLLSIVTLVSFIWTVVIAFKEHILWGLGSLFVPLVIIVFGIMYWDKAKKPFLTYIIASIVYAVLFFKVIFGMFSQAGVMDLNSQVRSGQITEQEAQQRIQQRMAEMFGVDAGQMPGAEQPQSAEDQISTLTEQMNERAEQAEQQAAAPTTQRIKVYNSIRISQARQYLGENIRIISKSGVEKQGKLKEVKYDRLVLERNLRGGDFAFEVLFNDIKSIEVEQWETY